MSNRFPMPVPYGWFSIGFSRDIEVGQAYAKRYFGEDLAVFRTESGEVKVLEAYCPHLGAHLGVNGRVKGEHISCPFHAWEFDGEGVLKNIPYIKNTPPKVMGKKCLHHFPVVEANGVVWVWYHPERAEPEYDVVVHDELTVEADQWGEFEVFNWQVRCHLQDMAENAADPAHFVYVHGTASFPETEITFDNQLRTSIINADMETPRGTVPGSISSYSNGPGQTWTRFTGICETLLLGLVTPVEKELVEVQFAFVQKKREGKVPKGGVNAAIMADICKQIEEDIPIWENKIYRPLPILCDGDGPIAKFRKWYRNFYVDYDEPKDSERLKLIEEGRY